MSTMSFDLVILDVMMPGEDGLSLLKSVREKKSDTPVILLTARSLAAERIEGLKMGADDYLSKPFEPEELALRITSVLKRADARYAGRRVEAFRHGLSCRQGRAAQGRTPRAPH
jgi:two-component system phosphate regulon response regulator OmpR